MPRAVRTALGFIAGIAAAWILDVVSLRRRGGRARAAKELLERVRPQPVGDDAVVDRVRRKLRRVATSPERITATSEHGCVELRGAVATRERARIVRALAAIQGVDSIVDLMTEPPPHGTRTATRAAATRAF